MPISPFLEASASKVPGTLAGGGNSFSDGLSPIEMKRELSQVSLSRANDYFHRQRMGIHVAQTNFDQIIGLKRYTTNLRTLSAFFFVDLH